MPPPFVRLLSALHSLFLSFSSHPSSPLTIYSGFLKRLLDTINFFSSRGWIFSSHGNSEFFNSWQKRKKKRGELDSISIIYRTCP